MPKQFPCFAMHQVDRRCLPTFEPAFQWRITPFRVAGGPDNLLVDLPDAPCLFQMCSVGIYSFLNFKSESNQLPPQYENLSCFRQPIV